MVKGPKTSEFWVALAVIVAATILVALGELSEERWSSAVAIVAGGYAIGRGLAKQRD